MADVEIKYNNATIASLNDSGTEVLETNGTFLADDITVQYTKSGGTPTLQSKTVFPSTSQQTVSPDSGYDGLSSVTVNAMPSGSATTPATTISLYPTITVGNDGMITASVSGTSSITPTVVPGYVPNGTAGMITVDGESMEYLTTQSAQTITPTTTDQTIASGKYLTGVQTIKGDTNLVASNIKNGVTIFGVNGSYSGGSPTLQSKTVTPSGSSISVTPDTGYDGLSSVTVNPIVLKRGVLLPEAELIKTYTYDKKVVTDEDVTLPSYSTTAQTLISSVSLSPTVSLDLTNYYYYVLARFLSIPIYNTSTVATGRNEYLFSSCAYEIVTLPTYTLKAANGTYYTTRNNTTLPVGALNKLFYWSSTSALTVYNTAAYGCYQTPTTPSIASASANITNLTLKSPTFGMRGHTTYFRSSVWSTVTDIRYQYIIDVYRISRTAYNLPGGQGNLAGWGIAQQAAKIASDASSASRTLT